ncbi:MAG TPA: ABC transporter substrate-binding protein [Dehalococcoidia bacterium]|nr:ABC transporter substrate-binding protein [Dehalococcoidia bacterium]
MAENYWQKMSASRLSRRRALGGAAGLGLATAALSLVGCGGGGDEKGAKGPQDTSGLLSYPQETKAKDGGVHKIALQTDLTTFDMLTTSSFSTQYYIGYYAYPRMMKFKSAKYPSPPTADTEPDLAESFEVSGDKLQVTFKLRQGAKWDPRAPTSSRPIDAEDVKWSWDKFASLSPLKADLVYSESNKSAPVESISTPDSRTVIFKMKQPDSSIIPLFAAGSLFFVNPREAENKFDPKGEVRGYGPWMLENYERDNRYVWVKNPNWYLANRVHPEKVEVPIIKEYAQGLAQFRAGNVYSSTWLGAPNQTDMIQTKKDVPQTLLRQATGFSTDPHKMTFGYAEGSPFRDERMRKALAMLIDREVEADFRWNVSQFRNIGLPMEVRYHNTVPVGYADYWLNPQDEKQMPGLSQYFKYNPAEAKKLMDAAGYRGQEVQGIYMGESFYGAQYLKNAELVIQMVNEGGIKTKPTPKLYTTEYLTPNYYYAYSPTGRDKTYSGFITLLDRTYPTIVSQLFATDHVDGPRFHGMSPNGLSPEKGDPQVNSLIEKMKLEFDDNKLTALLHEHQKYIINKMYYVPGGPYPTSVQSFSLIWPVLANWGIWSTLPATGVWWVESLLDLWIDSSKPPLGSG